MKIIKTKIVAVLQNNETGEKRVVETKNLVGNAGDVFYAQKGCGETPDNAFANCFLGTGSTAAAKDDNWSDLTYISGSEKAPTATYPKTDCQDADNSGAGTDVITYKYEWTTSGDYSAIREGVIAAAAASGSDPVLCRFIFPAAFDKDTSTTLKLFVNHTANGV